MIDHSIPVHPQPSIFETTVVEREDSPLTHHDIVAIMETSPVSVEDLKHRATAAMKEQGWTEQEDVLVPPKKKRKPKARR